VWRLLLAIVILVIGVALSAVALIRGQRKAVTRRRLHDFSPNGLPAPDLGPTRSGILRRYRWLAAIGGPLVSAGIYGLAGWPVPYAIAAGVVAMIAIWQADDWLYRRRLQRVEQQLADSIDLMIAAVKAGSSLQGAMESATENIGAPWSRELGEATARIRYGDDPIEVLTEMSDRVPLETVRLFAQTLAVNWSVGGRLAQTLANVGRTVRDRLELSRRMNAMTIQARLSVVSVTIVTYFIGALMWRNDPDRMGEFLGSLLGQGLVTSAVVLQAVGVLWISRLSTPRF